MLDGTGYVLFAVGAFLPGSHSIHLRVSFLSNLNHTTEVIIGAAVALLGVAALIVSDKLKRRARA
ncbi:MAG: hypothetical protein U0514_04025 [Candidatus Andersenbacteria bacterium]